MSRMTTQQKLDCLLKQFDTLAQHQGDGVVLNEHDVKLLKKQCGFKNHHEIAFYIRALEDRQLVASSCSGDNGILGATITIDGYCHLDTLQDREATGK